MLVLGRQRHECTTTYTVVEPTAAEAQLERASQTLTWNEGILRQVEDALQGQQELVPHADNAVVHCPG